MKAEDLIAAQQRRLSSKPPTYNKDCVGCEERAYEMRNVLDALEDNLTTVLEIYTMLSAGETRMNESEEAVKLLDLSFKILEGRITNIDKNIKEIIDLEDKREKAGIERVKPALDLVESVKWAKWAILGVIAAIGAISALLTQLPLVKIIKYFIGS